MAACNCYAPPLTEAGSHFARRLSVSWSKRFAPPIVLPDGTKLATSREAVAHLGKTVPKAERGMRAVSTAAEMLTLAAEHRGPVEFARIATLQAINRHAVRRVDPDRKDSRRGRRKPGAGL